MTGGTINIPIRGVNNEKINITTTESNLKAGTFNKIKRGYELGKTVILFDCIINDFKCTPITCAYVEAKTSTQTLFLELKHQKTTDGTSESTILVITSSDKIRVSGTLT